MIFPFFRLIYHLTKKQTRNIFVFIKKMPMKIYTNIKAS